MSDIVEIVSSCQLQTVVLYKYKQSCSLFIKITQVFVLNLLQIGQQDFGNVLGASNDAMSMLLSYNTLVFASVSGVGLPKDDKTDNSEPINYKKARNINAKVEYIKLSLL